jgi:acetyltransferase-like isoleucine patch superfamily enzyme
MKRRIKTLLSAALAGFLKRTRHLREGFRRLHAHASLAADLAAPLPASAVILGPISVFGTRHVRFGENVLLYPGLHLETQDDAWIEIGDNVVISRGTHIVAMAGVVIGEGSMVGEYTSIRDANHTRDSGRGLRESSHSAKPITIGSEVWIGRGVTILGGVTIGKCATVGANAVVTKDVDAGATVAGVPAAPIVRRGAKL